MTSRTAYLELTQRHRTAGLLTVEGFSNHLPMALGALLGLGASAGALRSFADRYAMRLPPVHCRPADPIASPQNARAAFSQRDRYTDLLAFFSGEIGRDGAEKVQHDWLDRLLQAPASTAFHSLIRLAYGCRFDNAGEVASGLADLASQRRLLPPPDGTALPIADALSRLFGARALFDTRWQQPPISQRLTEVVGSNAFKLACAPLAVQRGDAAATLDALCVASIDEYLAGMSFTALHLVTACHALRVVLPAVADPPAALRAFWPAWAAALVVARSTPSRPCAAGGSAAAWPALVERTLPGNDDHVIKMVFTCKEEHERTRDPRYLRAAACLAATGHA